jgi:hypothetical protein
VSSVGVTKYNELPWRYRDGSCDQEIWENSTFLGLYICTTLHFDITDFKVHVLIF